MPTVSVPNIASATSVGSVGVNTERTVVVPGITAGTSVGSIGVNTERTVSVPGVSAAASVEGPTLYITQTPPPITGDGSTQLGHIPVQEGYEVRGMDDFTLVRHDGGISKFGKHRQHSQTTWRVKATFVFQTAEEYTHALGIMLSGKPFETKLVIFSFSTSPDETIPGLPFRCYPNPESIKLNDVDFSGFSLSLEFIAELVV